MLFGNTIDLHRTPPFLAWVQGVLFLAAGLLPAQAAPWRWHWSNPLPHGNNIADLALQPGGSIVQVADHGQAYVTKDLQWWDSRDTGTRNNLRGATFLRDRLLISAESGLMLWSDDLFRFHPVDLGTEDWLEGVAASSVRAVAVGDNAAIYVSDDGATWEKKSVPFTNWLHGVASGETVFAAVGDDGFIATSPDGMEWTRRAVADGHSAALNRIAWTGNGFVVAGDAFQGAGTVIFGNSSGTSWVRQTQSSSTQDLLAAAAAAPGSRLVAGDFEVRLASGTSIISWSDQTEPPDGAPVTTYLAALWDGQRYVLGGRTGLTVHSQALRAVDRIRWTSFPSPPRNWLFDVIDARSEATNVTVRIEGGLPVYESTLTKDRFYVTGGDLATLMTSDDGIVWNPSLAPASASNQVYLALAGNARGLIAAGSAGTLSFSPIAYETVLKTNEFLIGTNSYHPTLTNEVNFMGVAWYASDSGTQVNLLGACATGDLYVVSGQDGFVGTSPDGTNWTSQVSGTSAALSGLVAWRDGFVSVGNEGTILTSPDAVGWTPQASGTTNWLFRVSGGPDQVIAVGRNGTILTSPDGVQWTARDSGVTNSLNDVRIAAGIWFVAGNQGTILSSTNGIDWTRDDRMITGKSLFGLANRDAQLVTVGIEGIILRTRVTPYPDPVEIVRYPQEPGDGFFVFQGELDQRFRLDSGPALNLIQLGPILTITNDSGILIYEDPSTNELSAQIFVAPSEP